LSSTGGLTLTLGSSGAAGVAEAADPSAAAAYCGIVKGILTRTVSRFLPALTRVQYQRPFV
jgi:hypothetical protein